MGWWHLVSPDVSIPGDVKPRPWEQVAKRRWCLKKIRNEEVKEILDQGIWVQGGMRELFSVMTSINECDVKELQYSLNVGHWCKGYSQP